MHSPDKCALIIVLFWICFCESFARRHANSGVLGNLEYRNSNEFAQQSHANQISSRSANADAEKLAHMLLAMQSSGRGLWEASMASLAMRAPRQYKKARIAPVDMVSPPVAELVQLTPSVPPIEVGKLASRAPEEADGYVSTAVDPNMYEGGEMLSNGQLAAIFEIKLTRGRALIGSETGTLTIFSEKDSPVTLLEGFTPGSLMGGCIREREDILHIIGSGTIWRCKLEQNVCSQIEMVPNLDSALTPGSVVFSVACDKTGHLYLGTTEGLVVLSESDEVIMRVKTSETVTDVRFDSQKTNRLYFTAGGIVWQFETNDSGDMPNLDPSIYKATDYVQIHVGW